MKQYDVAIIGAGPAGTFAAYELMKKPQLRIVVLESGRDIYHRLCPIAAGKVDACINCKPCNIMRGTLVEQGLFLMGNIILRRNLAAGSMNICRITRSWSLSIMWMISI